MAAKNCTTCKKSKPLFEFSKHEINSDGLRSRCRSCDSIKKHAYYKTKNGVISRIYSNQVANSQERNHARPEYNLNELKTWMLEQPSFHIIYKSWVESGYKKMLRPSCDRTDDYQGYSLNRLRVVTWQENLSKSHSDMRNGINNKISRPVIQINLNGTFVKEFYSACEAARQTGFNQGHITSCCTGREKTTNGYRFIHSLGIEINNNLTGL